MRGAFRLLYRLADRLLSPVLLWSLARSDRKRFEAGERALAYDAERGDAGMIWMATTHALYIEEKASPLVRQRGTLSGRRIPYSYIRGWHEDRADRELRRNVRVEYEDGTSCEMNGIFRPGRPQLSRALHQQIGQPESRNDQTM